MELLNEAGFVEIQKQRWSEHTIHSGKREMMGMGLSLMEFGEMTMMILQQLVRLYNELARFWYQE